MRPLVIINTIGHQVRMRGIPKLIWLYYSHVSHYKFFLFAPHTFYSFYIYLFKYQMVSYTDRELV
jgi:hypothetical protein